MRRLHGTLAAAAERGPDRFSRAVADAWRRRAHGAVARHGGRSRAWRALPLQDPARFSLAHGGKDRHPFPVPIKVYDETIGVLKEAVGKAKLGQSDELHAIRQLDGQARILEREATGPSLDAYLAKERVQSASLGGRSVFGWESHREPIAKSGSGRKRR